MICPECERKTQVIDSRVIDDTVWRKRSCRCGFRVKTYEVTEEQFNSLKSAEYMDKQLNAIRKIIG